MEENNKPRGIETYRHTDAKGISVVAGGVTIETAGKPFEVIFSKNFGKVYLVIDCSGSMAGEKLEQAAHGIIEFGKDAIRKKYSVGLIKFNSSATHISEPTANITALEKNLGDLLAAGSTNMVAAIEMAFEKLKYFEYSKVIIIATDGQPDDAESSLKADDFLKNPNNNPFKNPPKLNITPKGIRFKDIKIGQKKLLFK